METQKVGRYNAQIAYNGSTWVTTEQFNTIGSIGVSTATGQLVSITSEGLFRENYTSVKCIMMKLNDGAYAAIYELTDSLIKLNINIPATNTTKFLVEIEVFNITN